ncbi:MAG: DUF1616 domain-containing protein, partial [Chloroflexi bacterium]|nr:DUF1616 domain-containing protein [Chloroflexota bacterium]
MDLIIVALVTAASAAVVGLAGPPDAVRVPLMLPLALFSPGYSLAAALYPRRDDLEPLERLGLSFGLSLAALPLIGLALNYGPWGVRWEPLLAFLALLVFLACALGLLHRRFVPAADRFAPSIRLSPAGGALRPSLRIATTVVSLAPVAVVAAVLLVLLAGQRSGSAAYTEFYILPSAGPADSFPGQIMVGQQVSLTLGITNREGQAKLYAVSTVVNDAVQEIARLRLGPGERWQQPVAVTLDRAGNRQLLAFDLHVDGAGGRPYRTVYLWVDVLEPLAPPPAAVLAQEQPPAPTPAPTPAAAPATDPPHTIVNPVARGENQSHIAARNGVPMEDGLAANPQPTPT